jgi:hypothetical protein
MKDRELFPVGRAEMFKALAVVALTFGSSMTATAADPYNSHFTPIKAPECITNATAAFVAENITPAYPPHPSLPNESFFLVVRYLGEDSIAGAPGFDFSRVPANYGWPPFRGNALTGFAVPEPKASWQRAKGADADLDSSSAFQLYCAHAGMFINTWTFPKKDIVGGGPHAIYGYSFNNPPPPSVFDGDPRTDFVLQASVEIPWFVAFPPDVPFIAVEPVGQLVLFAYFRDRSSGKVFGLLLAIFDNRYGSTGLYEPFVSHDTSTPFVSQPLGGPSTYSRLSPYSGSFTGIPWTGLRFYRGHVTQEQFSRAIADVNAYCGKHGSLRYCDALPGTSRAFSRDPLDYEITDFGVLHEVFLGLPAGNLSMAVHVFDVGAWTAR